MEPGLRDREYSGSGRSAATRVERCNGARS